MGTLKDVVTENDSASPEVSQKLSAAIFLTWLNKEPKTLFPDPRQTSVSAPPSIKGDLRGPFQLSLLQQRNIYVSFPLSYNLKGPAGLRFHRA